MCTHAVILKKSQNYESADKQNFSWYLDVYLAVSGKAYSLMSHVMGGREREQAREKVLTYLI